VEIIHVYAGDSDQVTITCPECGFEKNINAKSFKNTYSRLKAGCQCSKDFWLVLDFRKYYCNDVKLLAEYAI